MAAWRDRDFHSEAHEMTGTTFLAHVRYATTGALDAANTHPFPAGRPDLRAQRGGGGPGPPRRPGMFGGGSGSGWGQTDSERVFALITAAVRDRRGDVAAASATPSVGLPATCRSTRSTSCCALRLICGPCVIRTPTSCICWTGATPARQQTIPWTCAHRIHARSQRLSQLPSVVFASEPMDDDPGWRLLDPGELVHVDADLDITSRLAFPHPPQHLLERADLQPAVQAAQHDQPGR